MPSIEISISVYKPGQGYSEKNFRRSFIIHDRSGKEKITKDNFKDICHNIKNLLVDYNNGERGNSWNYTLVRNKNGNKTQK